MELAGTDKTNEDELENCSVELVSPIEGLRFALVTKPYLLDSLQRRMKDGDSVSIGTEYRKTAEKYLGNISLIEWKGKSEGMIDYYGPDRIQGIFCLVRSGRSLEQNGLCIVEDDIERVQLAQIEVAQ
jgi:ATP phosphoribosyltransferase